MSVAVIVSCNGWIDFQCVVLKVCGTIENGVWLSLARAPGLGPGGRRFESCHPDLIMREWLSWWSTTLPRLGSRVRVPSRALKNRKKDIQKRISFFVILKPAGRKRRGLHSVPGVAKRTSTGCSATSHAPCSAPMLCVAKQRTSGRSATIMTGASC